MGDRLNVTVHNWRWWVAVVPALILLAVAALGACGRWAERLCCKYEQRLHKWAMP